MNAYNPEAWHELFVMLGGSLAALAGLLFVAVSIQIVSIRRTPHWQVRASGNTIALVGLLLQASLILVPQSREALGAELIVANLLLLLVVPVRAIVLLSRYEQKMPALRLGAGIMAWALGAAGGASLIAQVGGGMYLVVLSCLSLICLAVLNAWSFMMAAGQP